MQNSFLVVTKLNKINVKKKAKSVSTFDFTTLSTTISHKLPIKVFSEVIIFVFKSKIRTRIGFSKTSIYWTSEGAGRRYFTKQTLVYTMSFLINKCFFAIGNMVFKQNVDILMGIDPAPFWASLFLYFFESKYIKQLISNGSSKAYKYHGIFRFTDDIFAMNDGNEFLSSFKNIYRTELELKYSIFVYKLFGKRDKFPFFIV